ncbi:hypothetical protein E4N62_25405 [Streptomyces sp. MNU76]|uniref:hypothetical protein n=1 Tax=Streptomyces sp. MNU76 TaxID=2560026 RepID=UPI001E63E3F5|nr:hypothetical protein [Streptomyces sp. MNU76]MCC9708305.1 hypothetical protein [Streptomyces sp. MNU76]
MLTYQDVITVRINVLRTAAKDWDDMAGAFDELESLYAAKVEGVATDGTWIGVSAGAAGDRFAATRKQFADAQVEARALASILRDAHERFSRLVGRVKDLAVEAKHADMHINTMGEATYDFSKLTAMRHDPEYLTHVSKAKEAEAAWTEVIKTAVQAVAQADQGVKLALREAVGIKGWAGRLIDQALGQGHKFNGAAVDDIETYERGAKKEEEERKAAAEREKEKEGDQEENLKTIIRGISYAVDTFSKQPGDVGTKFVGTTIEGVAEFTGFNNTKGISLSGSIGFGVGIGGEVSLVNTLTPDGRSQINLMYSKTATTAGWDFGASGNVGIVKSNADDISQLKGTGWDKSGSFHAGIGAWGSHQNAIGATNSKGEDVSTFSGGIGLGVGNEVSTGFSQADGWTLWEEEE